MSAARSSPASIVADAVDPEDRELHAGLQVLTRPLAPPSERCGASAGRDGWPGAATST